MVTYFDSETSNPGVEWVLPFLFTQQNRLTDSLLRPPPRNAARQCAQCPHTAWVGVLFAALLGDEDG